jgi:hypothetical protein
MEGVRVLLLHHMGISSDALSYQRRSDGMAFGNLQSHFADFLLELIRNIAEDSDDLLKYQEELYSNPRLRDYNERNPDE